MFFISKNNKKEGPYTLNELQNLKLTDDMLVWKKGMPAWESITTFPELSVLLIATPPPLPFEIKKLEEEGTRKETIDLLNKKRLNIIIRSLILGALSAALFNLILTESSFSDYGYPQYHVFHSSEEYSDHSVFYWHIFPGILLIFEVISLVVGGIKIALLKPITIEQKEENDKTQIKQITDDSDGSFDRIVNRLKDSDRYEVFEKGKKINEYYLKTYHTDKGIIMIQQTCEHIISIGDKVIIDAKIANGRYNIKESEYLYIKVHNNIIETSFTKGDRWAPIYLVIFFISILVIGIVAQLKHDINSSQTIKPEKMFVEPSSAPADTMTANPINSFPVDTMTTPAENNIRK